MGRNIRINVAEAKGGGGGGGRAGGSYGLWYSGGLVSDETGLPAEGMRHTKQRGSKALQGVLVPSCRPIVPVIK